MERHNGNGHGGPLQFKSPNEIPIVGQPFTIKGWFPTVLLVCNCEGKEPVMLPRGGGAQCPSCKKVFTIQSVQFSPDGNVGFGIGMMQPDGTDATKPQGANHG